MAFFARKSNVPFASNALLETKHVSKRTRVLVSPFSRKRLERSNVGTSSAAQPQMNVRTAANELFKTGKTYGFSRLSSEPSSLRIGPINQTASVERAKVFVDGPKVITDDRMTTATLTRNYRKTIKLLKWKTGFAWTRPGVWRVTYGALSDGPTTVVRGCCCRRPERGKNLLGESFRPSSLFYAATRAAHNEYYVAPAVHNIVSPPSG